VNTDAIAAADHALEGRHPEVVLAWAAERFARKVAFTTAFGAEGCVLVDVIGRNRIPIDILTLDTGLLFPETVALWCRLEERYGLSIRAVRPAQSVAEQAAAHGDRLWERDPDRCCELRKVVPLRQALRGYDAWVTSIRRDQTAGRATARSVEHDPGFGLVKLNPLAAWTSRDVWSYLRAHDVPVNPLHARGYPSLGCVPCTSPVRAGEDPRAGRWRGRGKTECGLHVRPPEAPLRLSLPDRQGGA
jgi:thioredoxin-dependent adenylylsulfate APS reductase